MGCEAAPKPASTEWLIHRVLIDCGSYAAQRGTSPNAVQLRLFCRSELAREELTGAAFTQETRVIVDVFREQARSYRRRCTLN
ncbi:hypothetical protein C1Y21_22175 [Pseudomonas sp. MPR-R2A3]|nr:hypothetical protein C1Y21_22175 [Pseudomonas sp. MPR-R2A3]